MIRLKNKKEFIYKLEDRYYILGGCTCKECNDQSILGDYRHFLELTQSEDFNDYDVRTMIKRVRNEVAETYKNILDACYVYAEENEMTDEKLRLRDALEKRYCDEIERQYNIWIKADTCLSHKEIDESASR